MQTTKVLPIPSLYLYVSLSPIPLPTPSLPLPLPIHSSLHVPLPVPPLSLSTPSPQVTTAVMSESGVSQEEWVEQITSVYYLCMAMPNPLAEPLYDRLKEYLVEHVKR